MFFLFNIFLNTFALMHLDSLCAYLVFFVSLLLFWFSCVAFSCFFFRVIYSKFLLNFQIISRVTLFPLFILLQFLNICLLASFISLFPSVAPPRCALRRCLSIQLRISASGRRQTFLESTICVFLTPSSSRADLNLFYLLIALATTTTTIFH